MQENKNLKIKFIGRIFQAYSVLILLGCLQEYAMAVLQTRPRYMPGTEPPLIVILAPVIVGLMLGIISYLIGNGLLNFKRWSINAGICFSILISCLSVYPAFNVSIKILNRLIHNLFMNSNNVESSNIVFLILFLAVMCILIYQKIEIYREQIK